ncbi:helix-turn-helix domain-containing protein [Rhodococcus qingshengii]|uniref:helix-turn-helix domain-containing protein n=1 Tax=Rhodococcus qingshengii TaxID=334542 RepID=UPI0035E391C8
MELQGLLDARELRLTMLHDEVGASRRVIRWAYTTDLLDPGRYLVGGELVLSGLVWRRTEADSDAFVGALAAAGVAALVAGEGLYGFIPQDVVNACAAHRLPLLSVPADVSFGDITEFLIGKLAHDRISRLNASLVRQRQLLAAVAAGRALDELALQVSHESGPPCWVFTSTGRPIVRGVHSLTDADLDTLTAAAMTAERFPISVNNDAGQVYSVFAIGSSLARHRATSWYLAVGGDWNELPAPVLDAFGEFAAIAALDKTRREEGQLISRAIADDAIRLFEDDSSGQETSARLRQAGADLTQGLVVVVAEMAGRPDLRELARVALSDSLHPLGVPVVGIDSTGAVVALVNSSSDEVLRTLRRALGRLAPALGRSQLSVGVSSDVIGAGLDGALLSARYARAIGGVGAEAVKVRSASELSSSILLLGTVPDELRKTFTQQVLGPLLDYDTRSDAQLIRTLEAFLDCSGSWNKAAEVLHVHLNTVRYRISRIEELTGRDLSRMGDRLDMFLALQSL